jgi:hypothetical protein
MTIMLPLNWLLDHHVWRNHNNPVPLVEWHQNLDEILWKQFGHLKEACMKTRILHTHWKN